MIMEDLRDLPLKVRCLVWAYVAADNLEAKEYINNRLLSEGYRFQSHNINKTNNITNIEAVLGKEMSLNNIEIELTYNEE